MMMMMHSRFHMSGRVAINLRHHIIQHVYMRAQAALVRVPGGAEPIAEVHHEGEETVETVGLDAWMGEKGEGRKERKKHETRSTEE